MMQYFALSQGFLKETGGRSLEVVRAGVPGMQYYLLGQRVCRYAFAKLHTASWAPRLGRIYEAVMSGARSCPTDGRFGNIRKLDSCTSEAWSNIYSDLHTLYESVAETLPDDSDAEAVGGTESATTWTLIKICQLHALPTKKYHTASFHQEPYMTSGSSTVRWEGKVGQNCFIDVGEKNSGT